jgi:concanavalin A-like lectin/glucanase superfamily protein
MKRIMSAAVVIMMSSSSFGQTCTNWLFVNSNGGGVRIGDLDVTGDHVTVEATFKRTASYSGGELYAGDLVSKNSNTSNINYLLRPNTAEITTSNGYFRTPDICDIQINKTYHVAMVYDGALLKFYRDGFLMSQVPCNGNLVLNNHSATIGSNAGNPSTTPIESMIGYINEVRIWNVARTQSQIRTYMSSSLPNPPSQSGLLAYYTFDSLINKQGNSTWNGNLTGSASINQTNSNCTLVVDSCAITGLNNVENDIYKINAVFDSSRYLGFNVNITYNSDTMYGQFEHEEMSGSYIMNDKNLYYKLGTNEYMQNDSFAYSIYNDEKMIIMTKTGSSAKSNLFPMREFIDSVVASYDTAYLITTRTEDESKVIDFTARYDTLQYRRFTMYFDSVTHYPDKLAMEFFEGGTYTDADSTVAYDARRMLKRITMNFSNYYHTTSPDIFSDEKYVSFDKQRKKYRPSQKFKDYRFIANGVDGEDYDESIEAYPAPPEINN